jgi:hypothetical protein
MTGAAARARLRPRRWVPVPVPERTAMHHHAISVQPVERDCICLERGDDEPHIAACNLRFRAKFFAAWRGVRAEFYRDARF